LTEIFATDTNADAVELQLRHMTGGGIDEWREGTEIVACGDGI
jgi:hypothetical protein